MKIVLKAKFLAAITLLVTAPQIHAVAGFDRCAVLNVYNAAQFRPGHPVRLRAFELPGLAKTNKESPEEIQAVFMETLSNQLAKSKFFSGVSPATTGELQAGGFTLSGSITGMDSGNAILRPIGFGLGAAEFRVFATLADASGPVADAECMIKNSRSGLVDKVLGMTGMSATAESAAGGLARTFADHAKQIAKDQKANRKVPPELHGEGNPSATPLRDKPLDTWNKDDVQDAISNWVVTTNSKGFTKVDSLWLTRHSYEASAYYISRQGHDTGGDLRGRDWKHGFLLDNEPVEQFRGKDVLVVILTFSRRIVGSTSYKLASPFLWNSAEVAKGTYLTTGGGQRADPAEVLDGKLPSYLVERREKVVGKLIWRYHPVVFVFPAKNPDGKPFLSSVNQTVEIHSVVEGQQVRILYDLRNLGDTNVNELMVGGAKVAPATR